MTESEIRRLFRKIKEDNSQKAFKEFYDLCYDRFYRIAYFYIQNETDSREVVLDTFVKLWEKRAGLMDIVSIEDYCFILVKNTALNFITKESRHRNVPFTDGHEPEETDYSPEDTMISDELLNVYVKALDRLPERCREVFVRIKEEKQTYAQVADDMGISTKTVDAQLQKAMTRLREKISLYISGQDKNIE